MLPPSHFALETAILNKSDVPAVRVAKMCVGESLRWCVGGGWCIMRVKLWECMSHHFV